MSRTPLSSPTYLNSSSRKTMSSTQTYQLAHTARGKLAAEASRSEHRLHRLVTHANLLDSLMLELHTAEQEQERWFNQTVKKAVKAEERRKVRWADSGVEEPEEDWQAEDAASDSGSDAYDSDEEDIEMDDGFTALKRVPSHSRDITATVSEVSEEEDEEDEEDMQRLGLHLLPSHPPTSIPELDSDSDSSEDDGPMPKSPEATSPLESFSEKQRAQIVTTSLYSHQTENGGEQTLRQSKQPGFFDGSLFRLSRGPGEGLVTAISVY